MRKVNIWGNILDQEWPFFSIWAQKVNVLKLCSPCDLLLSFFLVFFGAAPTVYGGSQARGGIRAAAASLHSSHSNSGSEPCLRPTAQLMIMLDP